MKPTQKNRTPIFLVSILAFVVVGCLKTRSQVREERDTDPREQSAEPSAPVAMPPVEVKETHYAVDEIKAEIARLTGRIEDLERANAASIKGEGLAKLEGRLSELEKNQTTLLESMGKVKNATGFDDLETFEKGRVANEEGRHKEAIALLGEYLSNPKGKKASEATFLRGDSFFESQDYKNAIVEFSRIPEKFPKSKQLTQALYKIGLSFHTLGMKEDAKSFFQEVIEKHPKSEEAKKSRAYLK